MESDESKKMIAKLLPLTKPIVHVPKTNRRHLLLPDIQQQRLAAPVVPARQVRHVPRSRQRRRDLLGSLYPPQLDVPHPGLFVGLGNQIGGGGFALGADYGGGLFLFCLFDDEAGALGFLLGDLFLFDGVGEFAAKSQVGLEEEAERR